MGDGGPSANRVLHLAFKGDELVGCASSTFSPGWTPEGCGHWGLLAVDPAHQKSGVATALVLAAERRLATLSGAIQIEYQYTEGDPFSMRLHKWYEKLGFAGDQTALKPGQTIFRRCRKRISAAEQERGQLRRLQEIEIYLQRRLTTLSSEHEDQSPEEVEHEQSSAESDEPMEESTVSARLAEVEAPLLWFVGRGGAKLEEVTLSGPREAEPILSSRVVEKLAAIASVQAQSERIQRTEDMDKEDLGVLSMLQGTKELRPSNCTSTSEEKQQEIYVRPTPLLNYEANGVDEDTFSSLAFYVYDLSLEQQDKLAVHVMLSHPSGAAVFKGDESAEALAARFVSAVQKAYPENPFHNFGHAVDVQAVIVKTMKLVEADSFLSNLEQFSLLVAGLGHDIGHMGLNNVFLSEVGHELAIKYNDKSPLENMHCSALYQLLGKPETQLFAHLSADDYKEARRICVEVILHTDMMCHQNMVKDLNLLYQIHSEVIQPVRETRTTVRKSNWKRKTMHNEVPSDPMAVFAAPENKMLVMDAIVHSADVSNPAREWAVTQAWAERCLDEFFAQGDQERAEGVPVQFLNDREKLNRPNSQIGFIEFMIAPLFAAQIWLWPMYCEFGDCLSTNIGIWEEQWEEQTSPSEEEAEKVRLRVLEVQDMLSRASLRIAH
ncbi:5'-cyclic phosphodiesterase 9A [Durusdinium trenchii]|uniref:Phosphodiesterase n=1 Tax=Durusdinium trenchii TaxID=1381693 RepID=A0ABP0IAV2_9DINO